MTMILFLFFLPSCASFLPCFTVVVTEILVSSLMLRSVKFLGEDCSVSGRISGAPRVTVISVLHWGQVVSCPSHSSSASSLALQFGHLK